MRELHLLCNAHLDPVWLWEWPEGAAEALATFRTAAELCLAHPGFIFNHNEALLYRWVEEHDPRLFSRIRRLVRQGRWRVLGGWFLQPDCNMPSGESLVRQIQWGRGYFRRKFGVEPRTAANLDSFGHSRGLVQILVKAGYDSYLFCRPRAGDCPLPGEDFVWVGYEGSKIEAHRAADHYNSTSGRAVQKIAGWLERHPGAEPGLVLWGVGNHGGGPSRADLEQIARFAAERKQERIRHSSASRSAPSSP